MTTSQSTEDQPPDPMRMIDETLDLHSTEKQKVLFSIGVRTPCSLDTVAGLSSGTNTRSKLISRFEAEIDIDADGTVRLTENARPYVLSGSKPLIRAAQKALDDGKTDASTGDYEDAIEEFRNAYLLLESVQAGFDAVDHESADLSQSIRQAKQYHDKVLKGSTKEAVNEQIRRADSALSAGDNSGTESSAPSKESAREAYDALTSAIDSIDSCNNSLLAAESSPLSVDGVKDRRRKLRQTLEESSTDPESSTSTTGTGTESDSVKRDSTNTAASSTDDSSPDREELLAEIERLTEEMDVVPRSSDMGEHGNYDPQRYTEEFGSWKAAIKTASVDIQSDLIEDIQAVASKLAKRPSMAEVDEHGEHRSQRFYDYFDSWDDAIEAADIDVATREQLVEELQRVDESCQSIPKTTDMRELGQYDVRTYQSEFGSWDEALAAAGIDKQKRMIEELQRVAEDIDRPPTTTEMNELGEYSSSYVSKEFGSWQDAVEAAGISEGVSSDPASTSDLQPEASSQLEESAYETAWESIPDNDRLEDQLLVRATGTKEPHGDRKTIIVELVDRFGTEVELDVWKKHDVDMDWTAREWYALSNTRGTVWEDSGGETCKRLSSTRDLEVVELGTTFSPKAGTPQDEISSDDSTKQDRTSQSTSVDDTPGDDTSTSDGGDDGHDTGIIGDIKSEFDDL